MILTTTKRVRVIADPTPPPTFVGAEILIRVPEDRLKWALAIVAPLETGGITTVDWGDGTTSEHTTSINIEHAYAEAGTYTVRIADTVMQYAVSSTRVTYKDRYAKQVLGFRYNGTLLQKIWTSGFVGCDNLSEIHLSKAIEATIKATSEYQTQPQFGSHATVLFDL